MQTFLPFTEFYKSADVLDKRRCLKQVVEASQIIDILSDDSIKAWRNHPIVKAWKGYITGLYFYYDIMYDVCVLKHKIQFKKLSPTSPALLDLPIVFPQWIYDERVLYSHRCNLLRKARETQNKELLDNLARYGIIEENGYDIATPYYWPV